MAAYFERQVVPFRVTARCDDCDEDLAFSGSKLLVNPPIYVHNCTLCGKQYKLSKIYPTIEYKDY